MADTVTVQRHNRRTAPSTPREFFDKLYGHLNVDKTSCEDPEEINKPQENSDEKLKVEEKLSRVSVRPSDELRSASADEGAQSSPPAGEGKSLFEKHYQERGFWESNDTPPVAYPLHLSMVQTEGHRNFFRSSIHEGPFPPGFSAFSE